TPSTYLAYRSSGAGARRVPSVWSAAMLRRRFLPEFPRHGNRIAAANWRSTDEDSTQCDRLASPATKRARGITAESSGAERHGAWTMRARRHERADHT